MGKRTEIINNLFEKYGFDSYLEIGVQYPSNNFDQIKSKIKESVDPHPKGDCTYITTSDDFFENHSKNKKYDVIFIDGMHTAEQVYKDVHNALNHLNKNGFIVIHDCNPETSFIARTYEEFLQTGGDWCGTVFKGFIKLKNELKDYSCFVVNEDYGCGIITKRKILRNYQKQCDVNNIGWYFFNENRKGLLQLISFDQYNDVLV